MRNSGIRVDDSMTIGKNNPILILLPISLGVSVKIRRNRSDDSVIGRDVLNLIEAVQIK